MMSSEQFAQFITPEDGFAKTFIAKCNMIAAWDKVKTISERGEVKAAIVVTYSKREPKTANLQLLHTFAKHRKKGYAKILCEAAVLQAYKDKCEYFRVSSEPEAVEFYKKVGFKFIGKQKSGCQLSMFKLTSPFLEHCVLEMDSVIEKAVYTKRKGGCVEVFHDYSNKRN